MANDFSGNFREKIRNVFADQFESSRVLSRTVNTSFFRGAFNPNSGSTVVMKRPHQFNVSSTAAGDISGETKSDIISGSITCTKQNVLTVFADWDTVSEATELNQLEEILAPAAEDLVIQMETNLGQFMVEGLGLPYGTVGTAVDAWEDVAGAGAMLKSIGAPMSGSNYYVMNPFTQMKLASAQSGLSAADSLVRTAWENSQINMPFGGLRGISSNALYSYTSTTAADRAGTLSATPTATYASIKDTMTQTIAVTGFTASATLKAGDILEFPATSYVNTRNGQTVRDNDGTTAKAFRAVVTADVALDGAGAGNVVISGPAIFEPGGQYNTTDRALTSGDAVNIITTTATDYQPNLFYHENAVSITSVPQKKLYSTDTIMNTKDGLQIRVSKYADGDTNENKIRFDLIPAFALVQPFWGGQGFGV